MIEINLLPEELRKQQRKKEPLQMVDVSKLPIRTVVAIIVIVFVVLQLLAATTLFFKSNSLKRLNRRLEQLEPRCKIARFLKSNMNQLNSRLSAINELASKSILWSKKMSDLSFAITDGIWLNELLLQDEIGPEKQQAMLLRGSAVSYPEGEEAAIIAKFINSLKSHKGFFEDFQDIRLESSQMKKIGKMDVMDFRITCYFKKGRSYFDKPKR